MSPEELTRDVQFELELMSKVVSELTALEQDVQQSDPTVREKTAAGAFLAQFYSGVENISKRICRFHNVELPEGDAWHLELFEWFCPPARPPLPVLFSEELAKTMAAYRRFRHVVRHSYGVQLEWSRMEPGIVRIEEVFSEFSSDIRRYLDSLEAH